MQKTAEATLGYEIILDNKQFKRLKTFHCAGAAIEIPNDSKFDKKSIKIRKERQISSEKRQQISE